MCKLALKGQTISNANHGLLNSPKKQTKCTQDNFGRIEETINCFRDLLTFSTNKDFVAISKKDNNRTVLEKVSFTKSIFKELAVRCSIATIIDFTSLKKADVILTKRLILDF